MKSLPRTGGRWQIIFLTTLSIILLTPFDNKKFPAEGTIGKLEVRGSKFEVRDYAVLAHTQSEYGRLNY